MNGAFQVYSKYEEYQKWTEKNNFAFLIEESAAIDGITEHRENFDDEPKLEIIPSLKNGHSTYRTYRNKRAEA